MAQEAQKNRWNPVHLHLVGPLDSVIIDCGSAGETHIEVPLLLGESRDLQVPLAIEASFVDPETDITWRGSGTVQWPVGKQFQAPPFVPLSRLPLPVVPEIAPVLPMPAILGLVALALLLFVLRKRACVRALAALVGSALLLLQVGVENPNAVGLVRIFEMGGTGPWTVLDSSRNVMAHQPGQSIRLQVKPVSAEVTWLVTENGGRLVIEARSEGATLCKRFTMQPGMRILQREQNALGNLENSWVREEAGQWTARGPWALGMALPEPVSNGVAPPSWLVTGLPQGPEIWVARFAKQAAPGAVQAGVTQSWLRLRLDD